MARYKYIDTEPRLLDVDLSRQLLPGTFEHECQEHVTFIALCGDRAPHFTTIAKFVSTWVRISRACLRPCWRCVINTD